MSPRRITRRRALQGLAAGFAAPFVFRAHAGAAPSATLNHASFGANGMALADIRSLTASPNLRLMAVADVDLSRTAEVRRLFPHVRVYQDWRELLDRERDLQSANISTPDHMHAPITMRAMQQGLNVYTQKPLTQTIYEARQLARVAAQRQLVTQMGIQIHSHQVYSWSDKRWGDRNPRPERDDPVPVSLDWNGWLGVAAARPYIGDHYYHP